MSRSKSLRVPKYHNFVDHDLKEQKYDIQKKMAQRFKVVGIKNKSLHLIEDYVKDKNTKYHNTEIERSRTVKDSN